MALTREQIAARLREARESLGLTQAEVAKALGAHRPTISEIEAGRRTVATEELYEFARIYVTPVSTLLAEVAPRAEDVERVLFRRKTPTTAGARRSVRRLMERCRAEKELEELLGLAPSASARPAYRVPSPRNTGEAVRQGEQIAGQERRRLGVGGEPLRNPLELLERQGVRIAPLDRIEAPEDVDAVYLETEEFGACVGITAEQRPFDRFRSTFTAAHEYAHWLIRDVQAETFSFQGGTDDLLEVRANAFAAAFLMPQDGLRGYFIDRGLLDEGGVIPRLGPSDVARAMDHFGVSRPALLYRLQNLGMIDPETAESLRATQFAYTPVARHLGLGMRAPRRVGTRFDALVTEAWKRGIVTTGRAADLLGENIEGFQQRMRRLGEEQIPDEDLPLVGAAAR
jgi:Zn-dependent peptidase ImmA (M78 family)/transcriptional regulator with XRE-family HTH domain